MLKVNHSEIYQDKNAKIKAKTAARKKIHCLQNNKNDKIMFLNSNNGSPKLMQ